MSEPLKLTDERLSEYLACKTSHRQIAKLFGVSPQFVDKRVKAIHFKASTAAQEISKSTQAAASMFDTRQACEDNYRRCLALLDQGDTVFEKAKVLGEIRQHLQFGMQVLETLYAVQESQAFMEEVLQVIDECDPGTRERILTRLKDKRSVRAAFFAA